MIAPKMPEVARVAPLALFPADARNRETTAGLATPVTPVVSTISAVNR